MSLRWSTSSLSRLRDGTHPRPSDPLTPASRTGQADQTGSAGGCQKTWDPADRSFRKTAWKSVSRIGGQAGTQAPTLRPHHLKTPEAEPEARTHILPADYEWWPFGLVTVTLRARAT